MLDYNFQYSKILLNSIPNGFYLVMNLPPLFRDGGRDYLSNFGVWFKKWMIDNLTDGDFKLIKHYIAADKYSSPEVSYMLCLEDEKFAITLADFLTKYDLPDNPKPINDQSDYHKTMNDEGALGIKGIVEFSQLGWPLSDDDMHNSFEIWCWLIDNMKFRFWAWHENMYFENAQDAVAFKLRWIGGDK